LPRAGPDPHAKASCLERRRTHGMPPAGLQR
jgi:hypothetical protein